jgi:hypothetical protein
LANLLYQLLFLSVFLHFLTQICFTAVTKLNVLDHTLFYADLSPLCFREEGTGLPASPILPPTFSTVQESCPQVLKLSCCTLLLIIFLELMVINLQITFVIMVLLFIRVEVQVLLPSAALVCCFLHRSFYTQLSSFVPPPKTVNKLKSVSFLIHSSSLGCIWFVQFYMNIGVLRKPCIAPLLSNSPRMPDTISGSSSFTWEYLRQSLHPKSLVFLPLLHKWCGTQPASCLE